VEAALALLHWFRRLRIRWEIRDDIHDAFVTLGCAIICLERTEPGRRGAGGVPLPITSSRMGHLLDARAHVCRVQGLNHAASQVAEGRSHGREEWPARNEREFVK
jgi:hypothetical protein